ncbi:hypothetical protein V5O48_013577 [Marasmius crinis-equi]|uniref:F-box domain-containing protein n=1 Tax=Marasmius crinis-equi TaxID=585013 RepID=A0ABR3EZP7_9AGAR
MDPGDLKNLRLTSKTLDVITEQVFWAKCKVKVTINDETEEGSGKLEELKSEPESAAKIQRLVIELSGRKTYEHLRGDLPDALHALQGLRAAHYWIESNDPAWLRDTVLQGLSSLPFLSTLLISAYPTDVINGLTPLPLHHFCHGYGNGKLEHLSITAHFADPNLFVSSLSKVLVHNPSISHLDLWFWYLEPTISDLFNQPFPEPLRLKTLIVWGCFVGSTKDLIPHLRSIQRIDLHHSGTHPSVWDTLRTEKIHPRHIIVGDPLENFLSYIESFSGLETLSIHDAYDARALHDEDSNRLARRFYQQSLRRHQASLRELCIRTKGSGPRNVRTRNVRAWNVDAFDGCKELVSLHVEICEDDVHATEDPERHIIGMLVKHALALPKLRTLRIAPVFNVREGAMIDRTTFMISGLDKIRRIIESATFSWNTSYTPALEIEISRSSGTYVAEVSQQGEVRFKSVS